MRDLYQDLCYGARVLRRTPGFTAVAVFTLALGIAANTTVFSWIDTVLIHPIPGTTDDHRLVVLQILTTGWNNGTVNFSHDDYRTARDNLKLLSGIALYTSTTLNMAKGTGVERVFGELVSGNYFAVLGVRPLLGRVFLPQEYADKPGAFPVAVVSERLWRGRFGADPGIIGRVIQVNRQALTIVGVVPSEFHGTRTGLALDIWIPLMMTPQLTRPRDGGFDRGSRLYWTVARLNDGVSIEQARAELVALVRRLTEMNPRSDEGLTATVLPVWKANTGAQSILLKPLIILMAVCVLVLLIVCSNVANLMLSRSMARQREFSIRLTLGATRSRLARQLLVEPVLLALLSTLAGLPCAWWLSKSLTWLLPPSSTPVAVDLKLNADLAVFTVLICAVTVLISGVVPIVHSVRTNVNEVLKESGWSGMSGPRSNRIRAVLVAAEVALAFVALVGAGLFVRSFQLLRSIYPGFDARNVSVAQVDLSASGFLPEQGRMFCRRLQERLRSCPGIVDATYTSRLPLGFGLSPWRDVQVEGYLPAPGENMRFYYHSVAPGYFAFMRIPIVEGRDLSEQDVLKNPAELIVNENFARRFFGKGNPIGRKVSLGDEWFTVAGVANDCKYHSLSEPPQPFIYLRHAYTNDESISFCIRSASGSRDWPATLRLEISATEPNVAVFDAMLLTEHMGGALFAQKVAASLLSVLGGLSLVLAAVGLYSVMAYSVSQRRQEIGIRMALGAERREVLGMVVRQGMFLTGVGLVVGIGAAVAAARLVTGMLVNLSASDPAIYCGVALFLSVVALLASWIPARRATRIDPIEALRHQ